jgi:hypothetical protein
MTERSLMTEEQLITKAINLLMEKLGPVETSRFLSLPREKRIESVKRHRLWQSRLVKDELFAKVFEK